MNDKHIKIFTVNTSSKTAGLSPANNERIEIFFAGCKMAREGNQCEGALADGGGFKENSLEHAEKCRY